MVTLGRGYAWLVTGTMASLAEHHQFVRTPVETAQDLPSPCPRIAYDNGWVSRRRLLGAPSATGKRLRQAPADGCRGAAWIPEGPTMTSQASP